MPDIGCRDWPRKSPASGQGEFKNRRQRRAIEVTRRKCFSRQKSASSRWRLPLLEHSLGSGANPDNRLVPLGAVQYFPRMSPKFVSLLGMAVMIMAMLIAFVAVVALVNFLIGYVLRP